MRKFLAAGVGVAALACGIGGRAVAQPVTSAMKQKALDYLASFSFPSTPSAPGQPFLPTGTYASWPADERESVPTQVEKACTLLWAMAHDDSSQLLPQGSSVADEGRLGVDVSLLGHMPRDWPQRAERLRSVKAIFERAAARGLNLKMPTNIM